MFPCYRFERHDTFSKQDYERINALIRKKAGRCGRCWKPKHQCKCKPRDKR